VAGVEERDGEDRHRDEADDRERVRELAQQGRDRFGAHAASLGQHSPVASPLVSETLRLTGFVNAHSHTFQRSLRGRAAGGDFWAWRDGMLAEAERQTPDLVRAAYAETYREMLAAGYTAVGEFHYLGVSEARAAAEAAQEAGIAFVLLHVAYARGGLARSRQPTVETFLENVD